MFTSCRSLVLTAALAVATFALPARADVSTWAFAGGGFSSVQQKSESASGSLLQLEAGFGTPAKHALLFGGLMRTMTHFGSGTDWALLQRTASRGFMRGNWGAALDLGGYQRWWGGGSNGFMGTLTLGGPWGLQAALTAASGGNDGQMIGVTLGLDWARATVHRTSGASWWPNYRLPLDPERR